MKTLNVWTVAPNEKLIGEIKCDVIMDRYTCRLALIDDVDISEYLREFEEKNNVKLKFRNISSFIGNEKNIYRASVDIEVDADRHLYQEVTFKYLKKRGKRLLLQPVASDLICVNEKTKIGQMLLGSNHVTIKD